MQLLWNQYTKIKKIKITFGIIFGLDLYEVLIILHNKVVTVMLCLQIFARCTFIIKRVLKSVVVNEAILF